VDERFDYRLQAASAEDGVELVGGLAHQSRGNVAIDICGHRDRTVTEDFLYQAQRGALSKEQAGGGMAQV
jgi:hypothetical protein